jgi:hypothetical protein
MLTRTRRLTAPAISLIQSVYFFWILIIAPPKKRCLPQLATRVHSAKATSQTKAGFTHWIFSGILGGFPNGDLSVKKGFSRSTASFNPFSVKPLPECLK